MSVVCSRKPRLGGEHSVSYLKGNTLVKINAYFLDVATSSLFSCGNKRVLALHFVVERKCLSLFNCNMHMHTHAHMQKYTCMHAHTNTHMHACMHSLVLKLKTKST